MRQREEIEWVPVSEGLPPEEKKTRQKTYLYTNRGGGVSTGCRQFIVANSEPGGYVTAWANLPSRFKEDDYETAAGDD